MKNANFGIFSFAAITLRWWSQFLNISPCLAFSHGPFLGANWLTARALAANWRLFAASINGVSVRPLPLQRHCLESEWQRAKNMSAGGTRARFHPDPTDTRDARALTRRRRRWHPPTATCSAARVFAQFQLAFRETHPAAAGYVASELFSAIHIRNRAPMHAQETCG
jgi:hypothetical protein